MTTITLQASVWNLEAELRRIALIICDLIVDVWLWYQRERVRRSGRQAGAHRISNDRNNTVWDILHALPEEEFMKRDLLASRAPERHADTRGWRYNSSVWHLIERTSDEREWSQHWASEVHRLMEDIQFMLANPPQPETTHGCKDCHCGAADRWAAMAG